MGQFDKIVSFQKFDKSTCPASANAGCSPWLPQHWPLNCSSNHPCTAHPAGFLVIIISFSLNQLHPSRHSPTCLQASSNSTSGASDWDPSRWSIQIHLAGAVLGGLLSALLGSTIGRRSSLLASTLPDTMGWLLMAATYLAPPSASLPLLLTGRALTGLASAGGTSCQSNI